MIPHASRLQSSSMSRFWSIGWHRACARLFVYKPACNRSRQTNQPMWTHSHNLTIARVQGSSNIVCSQDFSRVLCERYGGRKQQHSMNWSVQTHMLASNLLHRSSFSKRATGVGKLKDLILGNRQYAAHALEARELGRPGVRCPLQPPLD